MKTWGCNGDMAFLLLLLLLLQTTYVYGTEKGGRDATIHQPSPHTKIAWVSNNTKGLLYLNTKPNK